MPKLQLYRATVSVAPLGIDQARLPKPFPVDMLRHDRLLPATSHASVAIVATMTDERIYLTPQDFPLNLVRYWVVKDWKPSYDLWRQLGWEVLNCKLETMPRIEATP